MHTVLLLLTTALDASPGTMALQDRGNDGHVRSYDLAFSLKNTVLTSCSMREHLSRLLLGASIRYARRSAAADDMERGKRR